MRDFSRTRKTQETGKKVALRYQVHIHHDGEKYVARVPELDGCRGTGESYAEALAAAEAEMTTRVFGMVNGGHTVPAPSSTVSSLAPGRVTGHGSTSKVMRLLLDKFGDLSNRKLAERIGLTSEVEKAGISSAATGKGSRLGRMAIALTLDQLPSALWPDRSLITNVRDDDAFYKCAGSVAITDGTTTKFPMDDDDRQTLFETMVEEYKGMFSDMTDEGRASWFLAMDESVILSFDVGANESPMQAEERHAVKLNAIAMALAGLPCADKERSTINDLLRMATSIEKRHEAFRS